ncbi:MAG: hypothetical protein M2R45_01830 [Verrucomicrobia subdivision 3 bacterium]|nr:hypothetical protein [Limisphaerales bacterium]MCS1415630.1 hypothetical protein [Limisphaerales bacterium]
MSAIDLDVLNVNGNLLRAVSFPEEIEFDRLSVQGFNKAKISTYRPKPQIIDARMLPLNEFLLTVTVLPRIRLVIKCPTDLNETQVFFCLREL